MGLRFSKYPQQKQKNEFQTILNLKYWSLFEWRDLYPGVDKRNNI